MTTSPFGRRPSMPLSAMATLLVALALAGCGDTSGPGVSYSAARAAWEQNEPAHYRYTIQHSCFCPDSFAMPTIVEVASGVVVSRRYESSGEDVPEKFAGSFQPIEAMFDYVRHAIEERADKLNVQYSRGLGYPRRISVDFSTDYVDDEVDITIRDFTTLTSVRWQSNAETSRPR